MKFFVLISLAFFMITGFTSDYTCVFEISFSPIPGLNHISKSSVNGGTPFYIDVDIEVTAICPHPNHDYGSFYKFYNSEHENITPSSAVPYKLCWDKTTGWIFNWAVGSIPDEAAFLVITGWAQCGEWPPSCEAYEEQSTAYIIDP